LIRQREFINEKLLGRLYQACHELIHTGKTEVAEVGTSLLPSGDFKLATATDERSGVYVQVAADPKGSLMTVGQRWAMEGRDRVNNTTATRVWS